MVNYRSIILFILPLLISYQAQAACVSYNGTNTFVTAFNNELLQPLFGQSQSNTCTTIDQNINFVNNNTNSGSGVFLSGSYNQYLFNTSSGAITSNNQLINNSTINISGSGVALNLDGTNNTISNLGIINLLPTSNINIRGQISNNFIGMTSASNLSYLPTSSVINNSGQINFANNNSPLNNLKIAGIYVYQNRPSTLSSVNNSGSINIDLTNSTNLNPQSLDNGRTAGIVFEGPTSSSSTSYVDQLVNSGSINTKNIIGVYNYLDKINNFTNTGIISSDVVDILNSVKNYNNNSSFNKSSILSLINSQGYWNSSPLTYAGVLPSSYKTIINGNNYGQLSILTSTTPITPFTGAYSLPNPVGSLQFDDLLNDELLL